MARSIFKVSLAALSMLLYGGCMSKNVAWASSNALDRINFGNATSEAAHGFVDMGNPTGVGALSLTYRQIAASTTSPNNPAANEVLTFTMQCSPTLQNYLTLQLWGSDTEKGVIYLQDNSLNSGSHPAGAYELHYYYSTFQPEIDYNLNTNEEAANAVPPYYGRFYYATVAIPIAMTSGKTSVTLTLNAAANYNYYLAVGSDTKNLGASGYPTTSRSIYSAFTHTDPYLSIDGADPQGTTPTLSNPTPAALDSAYFNSVDSSLNAAVNAVLSVQINSGYPNASTYTYGLFLPGSDPSGTFTDAKIAQVMAAGNDNNMIMPSILARAFFNSDLPSQYHSSSLRTAISTAIDGAYRAQSLNGSWGELTSWVGVYSTTVSGTNPEGRQYVDANGNVVASSSSAGCYSLQGAGAYGIANAFLLMTGDSVFVGDLNYHIAYSPLATPPTRAAGYAQMFSRHANCLLNAHGHAPNQDLYQAIDLLETNLALKWLDSKYGTSNALPDATVQNFYAAAASSLNTSGAIATDLYGGYWFSLNGLSLEGNGTGNGNYDGGYGSDGVHAVCRLAKLLRDHALESSDSDPVSHNCVKAVHAFTHLLYPTYSDDGTTNTMRREEVMTFRKNWIVGEQDTGTDYIDAQEFGDGPPLHSMFLEKKYGLVWTFLSAPSPSAGGAGDAHFNTQIDDYLLEYPDYKELANTVNTTADSASPFALEASAPDSAWVDYEADTVVVKRGSELLRMTLNWRQLQTQACAISASGSACKPNLPTGGIVNNVARVHDTTPTYDRIATIYMPYNAATGASGAYVSGSYGNLYICRYGGYLVAINPSGTTATLTFPSDLNTGTATDLVTGNSIALSSGSTSVPGHGGVVLALP